jgi:hypothetical protein
MLSRVATLALAAVGFVAGVMVTRHAHRAPRSPGWHKRVGTTRLCRADLPVGGTLALTAALVLTRTGRSGPALAVAALGAGAALGAVGTGLLDPLLDAFEDA